MREKNGVEFFGSGMVLTQYSGGAFLGEQSRILRGAGLNVRESIERRNHAAGMGYTLVALS